ncbi:MAG TPA: putative maltokinase, partial [Polyangiaceae bacterium]|nr:putative maltokinase [Polyangiaceae bacterium]
LEALNVPEVASVPLQRIHISGRLETLCTSGAAQKELASVLPNYLRARRWFRSKTRSLVSVTICEAIPLGRDAGLVVLLLARVEFREGDPEVYVLPVALAQGKEALELEQQSPQALLAHSAGASGEDSGVLYDGVYSPHFSAQLLELFSRHKEITGLRGSFKSWPAPSAQRGPLDRDLPSKVSNAEQSNTSIIFGNEYICQLFRKIDPGPNPESELSRLLTEMGTFPNAPALLGALEYQARKEESATLATLQRFVPHEGDAWNQAQHYLEVYYERCLALPQNASSGAAERGADALALLEGSLFDKAQANTPERMAELADVYPTHAELLGTRTAELHLALAEARDAQFEPEPFSSMYQRSLYESTRTRLKRMMALLRRRRPSLSERDQRIVERLEERQAEFDGILRHLRDTKFDALKIRVHGDYHLGQILFTGKDFIIIDFEGEPGRTLAERRFKHGALRDVASMIRSLDYAALSALRTGSIRPADVTVLEPWARAWSAWMSAAFLRAYALTLESRHGHLLPASKQHCAQLLEFYLLDKCLYELDYEFNNRPDWVSIPLFGLLGLLEQHQGARAPGAPESERNGDGNGNGNGNGEPSAQEGNGDAGPPSSLQGSPHDSEES